MSHVLDRSRRALVGERTRLRELREGDLPLLTRWWRDPEVAVFNDHIQPRPDAALEEMFRTWSGNSTSGGAGLCVETLDEQLIGHVALWGAEVRNRCATFAIVIGPEHQSRGLGSEAAQLMVDYGFGELGLHRIELSVNADNTRAIAAYRKAGFEQEGLLRSKQFYDGRFHDQVVMAALSRVG